MAKISRRTFLKDAALGALSLSAMGVLSACGVNSVETTSAGTQGETTEASKETEAPVKNEMTWDAEAEVVVVGSGTVITAAIAASEFGAKKVIVLEKSEFMFGGTSGISGGGYAMPGFIDDLADTNEDTPEKCLNYMKAVGEDRMSEDAMNGFLNNANEYSHWIKKTMGWSQFKIAHTMYIDYYPNYKDAIGVGRGNVGPTDAEGNRINAGGQWEAYRNYVDSHENITLMMGTEATNLITDENGAVIGLYAKQGDKILTIKAEKGVILGTGGFDHNENMRRYHLPHPIYRSVAVSTNTGDGQRMGAKIGGQLALMDRIMGVPAYYDGLEWNEDDDRNYSIMQMSSAADYNMFVSHPHTICVNRKGKRFVDENAKYDTFYRAFAAYDTGANKFENIPAYFIADSQYAANYLLPGYSMPGKLPEYVFQFDTLEELADAMGIDKVGLLEEVARYNQHVQNGVDPDYNRGENPGSVGTAQIAHMYTCISGKDISGLSGFEQANGTVEVGPFYCCRYVPGSMNTRGGLLVNENSQVVDVDGEVIPGLYATGTCSTGVAGYWAGGACISQGTVMSYVAAKHIYS